jgi:hypothetical protein
VGIKKPLYFVSGIIPCGLVRGGAVYPLLKCAIDLSTAWCIIILTSERAHIELATATIIFSSSPHSMVLPSSTLVFAVISMNASVSAWHNNSHASATIFLWSSEFSPFVTGIKFIYL